MARPSEDKLGRAESNVKLRTLDSLCLTGWIQDIEGEKLNPERLFTGTPLHKTEDKGLNKTALVTGAEGFIGSHLVKFLQAKGWNVVGSYRLHGSNSFPKLRNLRFVRCDLSNGQRVEQLFKQYEPTHVFHLGAQSLPTASWADQAGTFESNIMGSLHLFEAVRHMKRPPVVVSACSSAEYGHVPASAIPVTEEQPLRPLHPYGISKVCLDLLAREYFLDYKIPAVNLRLFNTTGPGKTNDAPSDFV